MQDRPTAIRLTRTHRVLIAVVVSGAVLIAAIGFAGSYAAVRDLALQKGFGSFSYVFPLGVDAGIAVLLALDLLLTWLRIPFPLLRQAAWLLTVATVSFNAAASWGDPVGVGMHGVIPILFVVTVEAARHAVGRLAAITADRHMEGVRLWRWLLAPLPTFLLWRRMMLWEIRRYDDVIRAEQERLVYQARLRMRFGRAWRWKAPVEELLPLRVARFGVPLRQGSASAKTLGSREAGPLESQPVAAVHATAPRGENERAADEVLPPQAPRPPSTKRAVAPSPVSVAPQEVAPPAPPPEVAVSEPDDGAEEEEVATDPEVKPVEPAPAAAAVAAAENEAAEKLAAQAEVPDRQQLSSDDSGNEDHAGSASGNPPEEPPPQTAPENHDAVLASLTSKADAVRYAIKVLNSTHTPEVVDWLKQHGQTVNRGQAHRITDAEATLRRKSRMKVVRSSSGR